MLFSYDYTLIGPQAGLSLCVCGQGPKENGPTADFCEWQLCVGL